MSDNDRIFVNTSYMHESAQVAWAGAHGGIFSRNERPDYDGELMVMLDGRACMKWWNGDGDEARSFVLVVDPQEHSGSYVTIYETEDQPPDDDAPVVWKDRP